MCVFMHAHACAYVCVHKYAHYICMCKCTYFCVRIIITLLESPMLVACICVHVHDCLCVNVCHDPIICMFTYV